MHRIGINGLYIRWGINAGTETYFTNIIKPWYESEAHDCCFTLYCNQLPPWWDGEKEFFKTEVYPRALRLSGRFVLEQLVLPFFSFRKQNVLFSPGYIGSIAVGKKQIVTIHDGLAWRFPKEIGSRRSFYWKTLIPISAKIATRVIAVSRSTAQDVEKFCQVDMSKIVVIREAGSHLSKVAPNFHILDDFGLADKSYFHCVGFFKEIKNPRRILQAYKKYVESVPINKCKQLVLVGYARGKVGASILEEARSIPNTVVLGRVDDQELAAIYKGSAGLVFPSLYEGFGIPILEAQSFGCPVITSNISSMPEVAGDGAIFVNPFSIEEIYCAMRDITEGALDGVLVSGEKNLKRFSWDIASRETLELAKKIAAGGAV